MPRGQPDYGVYQQQYAIAGMADLGEAVARLGSINIYDRRGFTVWMDDFEAPVIQWETVGTGGGVVPVLDTTRSVSGVQSVKLACAALALSSSALRRVFALIRLGRVGAEFWIQSKKVALSYIDFSLTIADGVNAAAGLLRYYPNEGTIDFYTLAGWVNVATGIHMVPERRYFLPIKFVVDMDTDYYVRLLVGEREFDLSAHQLAPLVPTANRYIDVEISLRGVAAATTEAYIDNFILTQNEP